MTDDIKPCCFCGCEAHDDGGASCMSPRCPLSALCSRIPSIEEWNQAWCHQEIERINFIREEQYQSFQKWKKNYFQEMERLKKQVQPLVEALEYYERMKTFCHHDDPSWCDYCPDAGKRARKALKSWEEGE